MNAFSMDRRQFLSRVAIAGASAGALGVFAGRSSWAQGTNELFKLSLAQWSLNQYFFKFLGRTERVRGFTEEGRDPLNFAQMAKVDLGFDAIEYVNQFFPDKAEDVRYLGELKKRADANGVTSLLIMIDHEGALGAPGDADRLRSVENHKKWVLAAKSLGCHSIRVNAASDATRSFEEQQKLAADGVRKLTEYAASQDLNIMVENHGGLSSHGKWLAGLIKLVDHPRCGTLPDFHNFDMGNGQKYDIYQGVAELMPYAKGLSAKSFTFDKDGNEPTIDFRRMLKIAMDNNYHGYVGVEYEGTGLTPYEGIRKTKLLLEKIRTELKAKA